MYMQQMLTHLQPIPYEFIIMAPSKFWSRVEWAAVAQQNLHLRTIASSGRIGVSYTRDAGELGPCPHDIWIKIYLNFVPTTPTPNVVC